MPRFSPDIYVTVHDRKTRLTHYRFSNVTISEPVTAKSTPLTILRREDLAGLTASPEGFTLARQDERKGPFEVIVNKAIIRDAFVSFVPEFMKLELILHFANTIRNAG